MWVDLDSSYLDSVKRKMSETKTDFLRKLVACGNKDKVEGVLAKISGDALSIEDIRKFAYIQTRMLVVLQNYYGIVDDIVSLNDYLNQLLNEAETYEMPSFDKLLEMTSVFRPYVIPAVDFNDSPIGVEFISAKSIHRVNLVSQSAVMLPGWVKNVNQLNLTDSDFHKQIRERFEFISANKRPCILLDKNACIDRKQLIFDGNKKMLLSGEVEIEVLVL